MATLIFAACAILPLFGSLTAQAAVGDYTWSTPGGGSSTDLPGATNEWRMAAASADATKVIALEAASDRILYVSTDKGQQWHDRTPDGDYLIGTVAVSQDGSTLIAAATDPQEQEGLYAQYIFTSRDNGLSWSKKQLDATWSYDGYLSVVVNTDGSHIAVAQPSAEVSNIYVSTNGGEMWQSRAVSASEYGWRGVAMNASGQRIAAIDGDNTLSISADAGVTWTPQAVPAAVTLTGVTISNNGSTLYLAAATESVAVLYKSTDHGATWTEVETGIDSEGDWSYYGVTASNDGTAVHIMHTRSTVATCSTYVSRDSGETWQQASARSAECENDFEIISADGTTLLYLGAQGVRFSQDFGGSWRDSSVAVATDLQWRDVAMSANGARQVAIVGDTSLYTSADSGATWKKLDAAGERGWYSIVSSASGAVVVAAAREQVFDDELQEMVLRNTVYVSEDYGQTWQERRTSIMSDDERFVLAISADASTIVAAEQNGSIYTSSNRGTAWTERTAASTSNWQGVSLSANGTKIIATPGGRVNNRSVPATEGTTLVSTNGGQTWAAQSTPSSEALTEGVVSQSRDGMRMVTYEQWAETPLYTSTDAATTWQAKDSFGQREWMQARLSGNGSVIVAVANSGTPTNTLHISTDFGATSFVPQEAMTTYGLNVRVSDDGNVIAVFDREGAIQFGTRNAPSVVYTPNEGSQTGAQLPINSTPQTPQKISNVRPTFTGVTYAYGAVTVTVNSDPIVCTTVADADGNWSCTLPSDIPAGAHTVTIELTDPETEAVTVLGPYYIAIDGTMTDPVVIDQATIPGVPDTGFVAVQTGATTTRDAKNLTGVLIAAGMGSLVTLGAALVIRRLFQ